VAVNTRQSKVRSNGKEERRIDQVVWSEQRHGLGGLQDGEALWQEVCAPFQACLSSLPPNQSTVQEKCGKEKDWAKKSELEK